MVSLRFVGAQVADAYFQDYPDRVEFFDYEDFYFNVSLEYYMLLDMAFQAMRKAGKQEDGFSNVEIPASWMIQEKIEVKYDEDQFVYYAETNYPMFSYSWDNFGYALGLVKAPKSKCKILTKISSDEWNFRDILPTTSLCFYKVAGVNRIEFADKFEEVYANYMPRVGGEDDNEVMVESFCVQASKNVLEKMFTWKNGNVIPSSNDGAKNVVLANQIDTKLDK